LTKEFGAQLNIFATFLQSRLDAGR